MQAQGRGLVALGVSRCANDTQAVVPAATALRWTAPTTEAWLTLTGQNVRVVKSCSLLKDRASKHSEPLTIINSNPSHGGTHSSVCSK